MFIAQGPNSFWMSLGFVRFVPSAIAVVYGIVVCVRNSGRKPDTARLVGIAIALLVCGGFAFNALLTLSLSMGWWDPAGSLMFPLVVYFVEAVLKAAGLALLFRAAFLHETPLEFDTGPPVYRNDDGPATDG